MHAPRPLPNASAIGPLATAALCAIEARAAELGRTQPGGARFWQRDPMLEIENA